MWKESTTSNSGCRVFDQTVGRDEQAILPAVLSDMIERISREVRAGTGGPFRDSVRVEIWQDSGRLIGYPATEGSWSRDELVIFQVHIIALLEAFEALADGTLPDDEFTRAVRAENRQYLALLAKAWQAITEELRVPLSVFDSGEPPALLLSLPESAA